ncbi:hypothetical protein BaRGS_00033437 [Batillaria attramentaria]|uniref:Uncharacterized protein n=1 Tax=Batillaria attramentaria TaxID=370345 RepID=A0ABD0JKP4_9CAEN
MYSCDRLLKYGQEQSSRRVHGLPTAHTVCEDWLVLLFTDSVFDYCLLAFCSPIDKGKAVSCSFQRSAPWHAKLRAVVCCAVHSARGAGTRRPRDCDLFVDTEKVT